MDTDTNRHGERNDEIFFSETGQVLISETEHI